MLLNGLTKGNEKYGLQLDQKYLTEATLYNVEKKLYPIKTNKTAHFNFNKFKFEILNITLNATAISKQSILKLIDDVYSLYRDIEIVEIRYTHTSKIFNVKAVCFSSIGSININKTFNLDLVV